MGEKRARAPKVIPEGVKAAMAALEAAKAQAREEGRAGKIAGLKTRIWKLERALQRAKDDLLLLEHPAVAAPAALLSDPDEVPEVEPQ